MKDFGVYGTGSSHYWNAKRWLLLCFFLIIFLISKSWSPFSFKCQEFLWSPTFFFALVLQEVLYLCCCFMSYVLFMLYFPKHAWCVFHISSISPNLIRGVLYSVLLKRWWTDPVQHKWLMLLLCVGFSDNRCQEAIKMWQLLEDSLLCFNCHCSSVPPLSSLVFLQRMGCCLFSYFSWFRN